MCVLHELQNFGGTILTPTIQQFQAMLPVRRFSRFEKVSKRDPVFQLNSGKEDLAWPG
jgi:hypothetical protein